MNGAGRIAAERRRQMEKEGWTPEHDDDHFDGALAWAAACYAAPEAIFRRTDIASGGAIFSDPFPRWKDKRRDLHSGRLIEPSQDQRIDLLVKAGALIAAEIDRLVRKEGEA